MRLFLLSCLPHVELAAASARERNRFEGSAQVTNARITPGFHQPSLALPSSTSRLIPRELCRLRLRGRYPTWVALPLESVGVKVTIRPPLKLRSKVTDRPNMRS